MIFDKEKLLSVYDMTKDAEPMKSPALGGTATYDDRHCSLALASCRPCVEHVAKCPTFWALAAGALGSVAAVADARGVRPATGRRSRWRLPAVCLPTICRGWDRWVDQGVFWLLALITLAGAVATITSQSPVYSAIWFAMSLLGTAGLFFFNGAQFLGVATVVVYAGAIVVTFLFVIMLAQPEGHSAYDRITWGGLSKLLAIVTAGLLVGIVDVHARPAEGRRTEANNRGIGGQSPGTTARERRHPRREAHGQSGPASVQRTAHRRGTGRHAAAGGARRRGGHRHAGALAAGGSNRGGPAMNEISLLYNYLVVGSLLFALGLVGFLLRRNMIVMFSAPR